MAEKHTRADVQDEGTNVSPYLLRPRRSYAQALQDLKGQTAEEQGVRSECGTAAASRRMLQRP